MAERFRRSLLLAAGAAGFASGIGLSRRQRRSLELPGTGVLITGGSRGLGLVLARQLAVAGARVAICARDVDELARASTLFERRGLRLVTAVCDVTQPEQIEGMVREVREQLGAIDVLINNAGIIQVGPLDSMTTADYEQALAVHFWAALRTIHAVLPEMRARRRGRIVNISSIGGRMSVPHLLPYSASKYALTGLSRGLRAELAASGVYVTTVCPGLMRTGSPRNALFKGRHREEYAWFSIGASTPLLTVSVEQAARRIIGAMRRGDAELVVGTTAKLALLAHDLAPGLMYALLGVVQRMMPKPGGIGTDQRPGRDSRSRWSPSWLTRLSELAAARYNEAPPIPLAPPVRGAGAPAHTRPPPAP